MRKSALILSLCCFLATAKLSGQKLIVNESLRNADAETAAVLALWETYFDHMAGNRPGEELPAGLLFDDPIAHTMTPLMTIYSRGDNYTFDIRRIDRKYFEIDNILYFDTGSLPLILFIYRHCAFLNERNEYELCSYFQTQKSKLGYYATDHIDFYYPLHYSFDRVKAESTGRFIERIANLYNIKPGHKAIYITADTLDECNSILGFKYSVLQSGDKNAGAYIYPNIIISRREDHLHELVHLLFKPEYPEGSDFIHEGLATYYGGSAGKSYGELRQELLEHLAEIPCTDIVGILENRYLGDPAGTLRNTLGAVTVEHVLSTGGERAVKETLRYGSAQQMLCECFDVGADEIPGFFRNLLGVNNIEAR